MKEGRAGRAEPLAFADRWKDTPCLGYTHLQPAQLTTVGKRAALWINRLLMDIDELEFRLSRLQLLGSKGDRHTGLLPPSCSAATRAKFRRWSA